MSGEQEHHLAPHLLREGLELLPDVLGECLDKERVGGPPVNHGPGHAIRGPGPGGLQGVVLLIPPAPSLSMSLQYSAVSDL